VNYQELIDKTLKLTGVTAEEVNIVRIDHIEQKVTLITRALAKYTVPFPTQGEPRPRRVKAVRR
jgi:hypothetical protein